MRGPVEPVHRETGNLRMLTTRSRRAGLQLSLAIRSAVLAWAPGIAPLRILVVRALVCYPLLRALLVVIAAMVEMFAGSGAGATLDSPLGVVVLAAALGAADIRRRGESVFWANLAYPWFTAPSLFGAVALLGELTLAWIRA
jgi:hypothetical protein